MLIWLSIKKIQFTILKSNGNILNIYMVVFYLLLTHLDNLLTKMFPLSSIFNLHPFPMSSLNSCVLLSLSGLSKPLTPILNPSKPSSDPLTVRTGALAYALAILRFRSNTITFAQISSSMLSHFDKTSIMWSWNLFWFKSFY